jgi:hypothetical protein
MFFLSRGLYGRRRWNHCDLYRKEPGYWFVEACCWTLEVDFSRTSKLLKPVAAAVFAVVLLGTQAAWAEDAVESVLQPIKCMYNIIITGGYHNEHSIF